MDEPPETAAVRLPHLEGADAEHADGPAKRGAKARNPSAFERARAALESTTRRGRRLTEEPYPALILALIAVLAVGYGTATVAVRVWYEALGPYNVDTSVYWAIGRGILNGLAPYLDLHETKPPGIFLLSALSYLVTGDGRLTHVTQILSILVVALSPLAYSPRLLQVRPFLPVLVPFLALWTVTLSLAVFAADYACEVQTEIHGLAGMVAYMLLLGSRRRFAFLGRAAAILVAVGFKEPFVLLVPAVYWVLSTDARDAWEDLVGPLLLAVTTGTLFLLVTGWLSPYVGIYLRSMVSGHVQMHDESVWSRGLSAIDRTWNELRQYSLLLPSTLLFIAGIFLLSPGAKGGEPRAGDVARRFQTLFLGTLLGGFAVGMGGHFYGHHFVFATSLHLALVFALLRDLPRGSAAARWATPGLVVLSLLCVALPRWVPTSEFRARAGAIAVHDRNSRESARVIDAVLDHLGPERYLWLGQPGWSPLPFTRHSPLGPLFFQQNFFFEGRFRWLASEFQRRLHEAKIVVLDKHVTGPLDDRVKKTLTRDFDRLPAHLLPKNDYFPYTVFVRKGFPLPTAPKP